MKQNHGRPQSLGQSWAHGPQMKSPITERFPQSRTDPLVTIPKLLIFSSEKSKRALIHQDVTTWRLQGGPRLNGSRLQMPWNVSKCAWRRESETTFYFSPIKTHYSLSLDFLGQFTFHLGLICFCFCPGAVFISQLFLPNLCPQQRKQKVSKIQELNTALKCSVKRENTGYHMNRKPHTQSFTKLHIILGGGGGGGHAPGD